MENIKIIRAQTQEDCDICDRFLEELCKFETQFDSTIEPFIGGKHHNLNNIISNNVYLAYAMINGTPAGYIMGYLKNRKGSGNNTNIVNLSTLFVKEEFRKKELEQLFTPLLRIGQKKILETILHLKLRR